MLSPGNRLKDDRFYWDFRKDVTEEARKFGHLVKVVIPRPSHEAAPVVVAGVGKVFLEYVHLDDAARGGWMGCVTTEGRALPSSSLGPNSLLETTCRILGRMRW
jgi:hypothetical protein